MKRSRRLVLVALVAIALAGLPSGAAAGKPDRNATHQEVALEITYVPPGVKVKGVQSGDISIENTVVGNCGWASMWVTDVGVETAKFDADAGTNQGIIIRAEWWIDWWNATSGVDGAWWGTTTQFSPTWGVDRQGWVDSGLVYGKLTRLVVTHLNGVVCQGLVPWDWEQVN